MSLNRDVNDLRHLCGGEYRQNRESPELLEGVA